MRFYQADTQNSVIRACLRVFLAKFALLFLISHAHSQAPVSFSMADQDIESGVSAEVPIVVSGFESITGFQFSLSWDPAIIRYTGIKDLHSGLLGWSIDDFNATPSETEQGRVSLIYLHPTLGSVSIADQQTLFSITFRLLGSKGSQSALAIHDSPLPRKAIGSNLDSVANQTADSTLTLLGGASGVVGRFVFFNGSSFDGNNVALNADDDQAIASHKQPLFSLSTATYDNLTNYEKGINGIMVDCRNPPGTITLDDFEFRVGNNNAAPQWALAPTPTAIDIREGAGTDGAHRVSFIWPDSEISQTWLSVRTKATDATGLETDDVFFFGNAIGKTSGDSTAQVGAQDELRTRANPRNFFNKASIDFPYDFNRDGFVNATDQLIARSHITSFFTRLQLIQPTDQ